MKLISSVNVVLCSNIYDLSCYECVTQSCCKVGTGFKDEDLLRLNENMKALVVPSGRKPFNYNVGDPLTPDDWFEASALWELQAADLSKSRCVCVCVCLDVYLCYLPLFVLRIPHSVHKAGTGRIEAGRGIGLRFPRFLRERHDKRPEQATSSEQIVEMFHSQGETAGPTAGAEDDDDELI